MGFFFFGYLLGGLTLIPGVLVFAWFWCTTPVEPENLEAAATAATSDGQILGQRRTSNGSGGDKGIDGAQLGVGLDHEILEKLKGRAHEPDACAGYFAVCREYVPGGVNGKPPDRTTPAGAVVAVESPSVYQSMYRSIFDRNKTTSPSIEASNAKNKKARNVFYVVLRLGHLMLYDNEDQLEVRHVISLAHYKVDLYGGGDRIPEGELWIKRNCIRLVQQMDHDSTADTKSFYLFSDNCSEKEDFYHAMLHAQESQKDPSDTGSPSIPLKFDTTDLVKLVQQLHASEENLHTRWINALIGRVFLALYKTSQIKDFIAAKINKKIARVPKPAIISSVQLRKVDMGTLPPFITNPKLKELTVDGDLVVEADVSYKGNFRIEISATVRIDLGTRFKAREVVLVLATVLKRLDGHFLIRVKPPPSNRLWMTFETPPKMEFSLEPIITYGVVLRAIENRIREVVNETLVLPNWDDMPFTDTIAQVIRGGIWEDSAKDEEDTDKIKQDDAALETAISDAEKLDEKADGASAHFTIASSIDSEEMGTGVSSSADVRLSSASARPRTMRSSSSTAQVKLDAANASAEMVQDRSQTPTSIRSLPGASPMRPNNTRQATESSDSSSEEVSVASISAGSTKSAPTPSTENLHNRSKSRDLSAQEIAAAAAAAAGATSMQTKKQTINQSLNSATTAARNWLAAKQNNRANSNNSNTNRPPTSEGPISADSTESFQQDSSSLRPPLPTAPSSIAKSHTEPMGRGQPLPPPGTPLPPPSNAKRQTWAAIPAAASTFANTLTKRRPVGLSPQKSNEDLGSAGKSALGTASLLPPAAHFPDQDARAGLRDEEGEEMWREMRRSQSTAAAAAATATATASAVAASELATVPPPLPKRRQRQPSLNQRGGHNRRTSQNLVQRDDGLGEGLLVVEAPVAEGSAPTSPVRSGGRTGKRVSLGEDKANERGIT
ncbi:PH domain-containing [Pyrenophora seminiperda CCB06]|uniref:PH domain-containing n=1 Tax=Pyrenophora seminiperda CCB06 TaxID=1302712 RepID=A0A3M7MCU7_9PLEO|nr:PH domain-containing [Pyrenophora seminiperda CCB06]